MFSIYLLAFFKTKTILFKTFLPFSDTASFLLMAWEITPFNNM